MSELDRIHYQLLLAIDRLGTISAAARDLYITQSAASQRLRQAERRLGFALTTRVGRTVVLTPAAERLVEAARRSESTLRAAEADARWLASSGEPSLELAVDVHDALWWLPSAMAEIDDDPDCASIEVVRTLAGGGTAAVADGRADVLVTPHSAPTAFRHLFDDDLVAVVARTHELAGRRALTPDDFVDCDYVTYSTTPQDGFEHATFFAPHQVWPRRILRLESVTAILSLVAATNRVTVLPEWAVPPSAAPVTIPLDPRPPTVSWNLVAGTRSDPGVEATTNRLTALLRRLREDRLS
ncbi:MAG: LysR family transcriptional regulator [Ilumatobacteraceae bacterium]